MRAAFGVETVTPGRKSLKLTKGKIPAAADVVVTLQYENSITFYLPDERRWVVSYPQQHHTKGLKKERVTDGRYKRTIRMFKAVRNHLVEGNVIKSKTAPSYFIECLLYNVPNGFFRPSLSQSYSGIVEYLKTAKLQQFRCQNGVRELFGPSRDLWNMDEAKQFIRVLGRLWDNWPRDS
jgi:hypothetical protein